LVFLVVSFLLAFPPISYMHCSSPPFVLYALPISSSLTYHSNYVWRGVQVMKLLIANLIYLRSLHLSSDQIFSSAPCSQTPSVYVP
jgi:hypothetical protein